MPKQDASASSASQLHLSRTGSSQLHMSHAQSSRVSSQKQKVTKRKIQTQIQMSHQKGIHREESDIEAGSSEEQHSPPRDSTIIEERDLEEEGNTSSDANMGLGRRFAALSAIQQGPLPINSSQRQSTERSNDLQTSLYSGGHATNNTGMRGSNRSSLVGSRQPKF